MVPESSAYAIHTNLPRVGLLMAGDTSYPSYAAFLERLRALGHTEDQTVRMEVRFAEGRLERLPNLASELVALHPDVLAVIGAVSFFAAEKAASAIPIVFSIVLDAVEAGLVSNADRPGGRVTGATSYDPGQVRRQIELLKQVIPNLSRLAILGDAGVPPILAERCQAAASSEMLQADMRLLRGADDIEPAMREFHRDGSGALLVLEVPRTSTHAGAIVAAAHEVGLPTMFGRDLARVGPMLAYGTSFAAAARRMADLVNRVLHGASPGDLSVEQVIEPQLVVNLAAARSLGVNVPPEVLAQAAEVVS
jgi:putative tryptophan/tyrosine transport system substrate-binding protein